MSELPAVPETVPERKKSSAAKIDAVQVLRGLAACGVMFSHIAEELLKKADGALPAVLPVIVAVGRGGVDVFFVISGFVMMYVSMGDFGSPDGPRRFVLKRVARVVPVYWFYTTLMLVIVLVAPGLVRAADRSPGYILASYFFFPVVQKTSGEMQPLLELGWTLNYEMYFYLIFAGALFLQRRAGIVVLALYFSAAVLVGAFLGPSAGALWYWTRPIILQFLAGAILAVLFFSGVRVPRYAALALSAGGLLWLIAFYDDGNVGLTTLSVTAICWVAAATLVKAKSSSVAGNSPLWRFLLLLGDASYSLYLVHMFVIRAVSHIVHSSSSIYLYAFPALVVPVSIICAIASYRYIEIPSNIWLRQRLLSLHWPTEKSLR
jgi:peptidoglycan/LPS O-acetylase OafA/YrhL